jgi:ribose 5-phosphate isomerase B
VDREENGMRIAIGSDHRGVDARRRLISLLERLGNEVVDCGTDGTDPVDYPDIAASVANRVSDGSVERGILLCCTGVGMAIAANKVAGVRAATCHDEVTAEMSRRHNDLNVLCLSAEMIGPEVQDKMIRTWLATPFEGGRHARRLEKIEALETACGERMREKSG